MKAIVIDRYGAPEDMRLTEVDTPIPADDQLLVRVYAASVNSWDCDYVRGRPWMTRMEGVFRPKYRILGADISGIVEAVGSAVTDFVPGDAVYGDMSECGWGGFAEYATPRASCMARKPPGLGFVEAAAIPQAGLLALQGLRTGRPLASGEHVLINGGGGGTGAFAIQIASNLGARVTAVDSAQKRDFMKDLGAHHVIDYKQADFTRKGVQYDFILDMVARHGLNAYTRALTENGRLVVVGGTTNAVAQAGILGPIMANRSTRSFGLLLWRPDMAALAELGDWCARGRVRVPIDGVYTLARTGAALRRVQDGLAQGKVVVQIAGQ